MKLFYCLLLLPMFNNWVLGQTNYVVTTPNSATPAQYNTIVGPAAGSAGMSGDNNAIFGYEAGYSLTGGAGNLFMGYRAGNKSTLGGANVFLGNYAGYSNTGGGASVFIGNRAGYSNTTGSGSPNVFVGNQAGFANTIGANNTYLGGYAGVNNVEGGSNVLVGYFAGHNNTANNNTIIGSEAGYYSKDGNNNVFLGNQSGYTNTAGSNNVFVGLLAGANNYGGNSNMYLGSYAGFNCNGSYNMYIGNSSGYNTTTGLGNTFIGDGSGYGNSTGQNNTYIGRAANFSGNPVGNQNTFIGFQARTDGGNVDNSTAIGVNAIVSQSNSVILGALGSQVGIGNSAPSNTLEITKGILNQSGLRFTNLNNSSPATVLNQTKFLSVNQQGDVVLASINGSAREGVAESLWQRKGSYLQSTQNDAVIIGEGINKTPSDYNLFVSKGILTEKVKVAIKNNSAWSDYVFEPNYSLKSLSEVEQYIQTYGHLPGIPSGKEVVEKGVDLAKMDAKLLAKIEELILYSIQHEKENKILRAEVNELKNLVKKLLNKK